MLAGACFWQPLKNQVQHIRDILASDAKIVFEFGQRGRYIVSYTMQL